MNERGFTLIELLVVILIIGVLAAIALPTFIGQKEKAHDTSAKSDVRNAVTQVEACFTQTITYAGCPAGALPVAPGVAVTSLAAGTQFRASKLSDTGTTFTIRRLANGYTRTCDQPGVGGCSDLSRW